MPQGLNYFLPSTGITHGHDLPGDSSDSRDGTQDLKLGENFADWPKTPFVNSSKVKVEELVFTHKSEERGGECESSQK